MEKVYLKAKLRTVKGKGPVKLMRKLGEIPAVMYGEGKNEILSIGRSEFIKLIHSHSMESTVIVLKIEDGKKEKDANVLIKELQRNPVDGSFQHVDFQEISLTKAIEVKVPLHAKGEPEGAKLEGGTLEHLLWELKIQCLPTQIPNHIEVDVSHLKLNENILIKDIKVPEGIKLLHDGEQIAISLKPPKADLPPVGEPGAEAQGPAEPEVLKQKTEEQLAKEAAEKEKEKKEKE